MLATWRQYESNLLSRQIKQPWGFKIKRLAAIAKEHGCSVDSMDYTDLMDPEQRVERSLDALKQEAEPFVLVGSSMGG